MRGTARIFVAFGFLCTFSGLVEAGDVVIDRQQKPGDERPATGITWPWDARTSPSSETIAARQRS